MNIIANQRPISPLVVGMTIAVLFSVPALIAQPSNAQTVLAKPSPEQLAFMDMEQGAFIHYDLNPFTGRQKGDGKASPSLFNPSTPNVEQWVLAVKGWGARYAVLTARHEGGFCLWPTKTTDYSVQYSPYKDGKGDIVREFVDACRKHGIVPGLYHTPTMDARHADGKGTDEERSKYKQMQVDQVTELLTDYGPIGYLWLDHWDARNEFDRAATDTARRLQPKCLVLGVDTWVPSNESGHVVYPMWCAVGREDGTIYSRPLALAIQGDPHGKFWCVRECDTATGFYRGGWFWRPDTCAPRPPEELIDLYYRTIGLGANLIMNFPPDTRGLVPQDLVDAAKAMHDEIARRFLKPVAELKTVQQGDVIELGWRKPERIDHVVLMENVVNGQKVAEYILEAQVDGKWQPLKPANQILVPIRERDPNRQPLYKSSPGFLTIGHKKIDRIEPVVTDRVRFRCLKSIAQPVEIRSFAVFNVMSN